MSQHKEGLAARSMRAQLKKQGRGPTIMEHAVIKAGVIKGGEVVWNLAMWTIARRKFGQAPNAQQFGEIALVKTSMSYRALRQLDEIYGEHLAETADALQVACGKQLDVLMGIVEFKERRDLAVVAGIAGTVPAPAVLAL